LIETEAFGLKNDGFTGWCLEEELHAVTHHNLMVLSINVFTNIILHAAEENKI
jgi:hypothetical protein